MNSVTIDVQPWYKQFWPWFIIALPASVVVAGFTTLYIAIVNNDYRVDDDYYKDGFHLQRNDVADRIASAIGVRATLQWSPAQESIVVTLGFDVELPPADRIALRISHPNNASLDIATTATPAAGANGAEFHAVIPGGDVGFDVGFDVPRNITLTGEQFDASGESVQWRLRGRCHLSAASVQGGAACQLLPSHPAAEADGSATSRG